MDNNKKSNIMFIDGGARGNPGESGIGIVLINNNNKKGYYYYTGYSTNNQAEYYALIKGLKLIKQKNIKSIKVYSDSELMCNQINGVYKIKNDNLLVLFNQVKVLIGNFDYFSITHIPREKNKEADKLVNIAIDSKKNGEIEFAVASPFFN